MREAHEFGGGAGVYCGGGPEVGGAAGIGFDVVFEGVEAGRFSGGSSDSNHAQVFGGFHQRAGALEEADGHFDVGGAGDFAGEADGEAAFEPGRDEKKRGDELAALRCGDIEDFAGALAGLEGCDADGRAIGFFEEGALGAELREDLAEFADGALAHAGVAVDGERIFGEERGGSEEASCGAGVVEIESEA